MYGYIYLLTNLINGKMYIGKRKSKKFLGNSYLGSGTRISLAVEEFGKENFTAELLETAENKEDLIELERYYIFLADAVNSDLFYNVSHGGVNEGFVKGLFNIAKEKWALEINSKKHKGKKMSDEFRLRLIEIHTGKPSGMLGHKHSDETKAILAEYTRYNNINNLDYTKISESAKGNKMMKKDGICVRVHPEKWDEFLANGWEFGGLPRKKGIRKNNKDRNGCKVYINDGNMNLLVDKILLSQYLNNGYKLGLIGLD